MSIPNRMPALKTSEFMREFIYEILQVDSGRWIINDPRDRVRQKLLAVYIDKHFKDYTTWTKKWSKKDRKAHSSAFNTSIFGWLKKEYKPWVTASFQHVDSIVGPTDVLGSIYHKAGNLTDHICNKAGFNCGNNRCANRKIFLEWSDSCKSSPCRNKESREAFNWREFMLVTLINDDKGIGVVAVKDLPKGLYLGPVTGKFSRKLYNLSPTGYDVRTVPEPKTRLYQDGELVGSEHADLLFREELSGACGLDRKWR